MAERPPALESDPRRHTTKVKAMLSDVISHAREDLRAGTYSDLLPFPPEAPTMASMIRIGSIDLNLDLVHTQGL